MRCAMSSIASVGLKVTQKLNCIRASLKLTKVNKYQNLIGYPDVPHSNQLGPPPRHTHTMRSFRSLALHNHRTCSCSCERWMAPTYLQVLSHHSLHMSNLTPTSHQSHTHTPVTGTGTPQTHHSDDMNNCKCSLCPTQANKACH